MQLPALEPNAVHTARRMCSTFALCVVEGTIWDHASGAKGVLLTTYSGIPHTIRDSARTQAAIGYDERDNIGRSR